jgi:transposase
MAKAYSYDLRQKVIQAIELDGLKKSEASELFNISRNTINLWFQLKEETGDLKEKLRQGGIKIGKITDWENFREFVSQNGDKTQAEMAQLWEGEISARTISRALQKIGFTRKKKLMATRKEMKSNERFFWSS